MRHALRDSFDLAKSDVIRSYGYASAFLQTPQRHVPLPNPPFCYREDKELWVPWSCAVTIVGTGSHGATGSDGATCTVWDTTGCDFFVAFVSTYYANAGAGVMEDSKSNGWIALTRGTNAVEVRGQFYYSNPTSVGTLHTMTYALSGGYPSICVTGYAGVHATPFGGEAGAMNASAVTSIAQGALTPSEANCLAVSGVTTSRGAAGAQPTQNDGAFTIQEYQAGVGSVCYDGCLADCIQTTAAEFNPTWSWTPTANTVVRGAWFKSAAGGGGGAASLIWSASRTMQPLIVQ